MDTNNIVGDVVCVPKALPMNFESIWKNTNEEQRIQLYKTAKNRAKHKLQKQKKKTGVAILGKPVPCLENDPKFQGKMLQQSIKNGEDLALASLTAEFLLLDTCKVPLNLQYQYTGRAQYPKIKSKPMADLKSNNKYQCAHLLYWGEVRGILTGIIKMPLLEWHSVFSKVQTPLISLLGFAKFHVQGLSDTLKADGIALENHVTFASLFTLQCMLVTAKKLQASFSKRMGQELCQGWDTFVKFSLAKGGGPLFKYISKWDKQFLNVNWASSKGNNNSPKEFL